MDYDAIVIGSGAGGMAAALPLAQAGERVLLIEQHEVPGGLCHSFTQEGHRYSPGVHYIGQLGENEIMRDIYEGLGVADHMRFFEMNPQGYEHVQIGNRKVDIPAGKDNFENNLIAEFPKEAKGIKDYLFLLEKLCEQIQIIQDSRTAPLSEVIKTPFRTRLLGGYGLRSLKNVLDARMKDQDLKAILAIQCGDHGMPPSRTPFGFHAAVSGHYLTGGYYPEGGGRAIPKAFVKGLQQNNADILLSTSVEKILTEKSKKGFVATGVELSDGRKITAKRVISNASPEATYLKMLGEGKVTEKMQQKLANTKYTVAPLMLYLSTDLDLPGCGYDSGNYWYSETNDPEKFYDSINDPKVLTREQYPGVFIGITSIKDPGSYKKGEHVLEAVSFISYEFFAKWQDTDINNRPQEYYALKETLTASLLKAVYQVIPELEGKVKHCDLSTPLTSEYYVRAHRGSSYGSEKVLKQLGPFSFANKSEVQGLYLCGASTNAHGIAGATNSGLSVAANILRCQPKELYEQKKSTLDVIYSDA